jgi:phytoene dehydrogenase-like protein
MTQRNIGWIALGTCIMAVSITALVGRDAPQSADASAAFPQVTADNTQACRAVIGQIITIQQTAISQKHSGNLLSTPFAAVVAQESQIDTSQCPPDFRAAVTHFIAAETIASFNARMDTTGKLDRAFAASVETSATRGFTSPRGLAAWDAYGQNVDDNQKQDFANIQSALVDLVEVAGKYGVK